MYYQPKLLNNDVRNPTDYINPETGQRHFSECPVAMFPGEFTDDDCRCLDDSPDL